MNWLLRLWTSWRLTGVEMNIALLENQIECDRQALIALKETRWNLAQQLLNLEADRP